MATALPSWQAWAHLAPHSWLWLASLYPHDWLTLPLSPGSGKVASVSETQHQVFLRSQAAGEEEGTPTCWEVVSLGLLHTHQCPFWSPGPSHAQPQSSPTRHQWSPPFLDHALGPLQPRPV